ncbi:MAG: hypothetical protein NT085_05515 [candidate division SR1 bacterium]|nr:hypothetical protein [candidate division SR1 bacterium]
MRDQKTLLFVFNRVTSDFPKIKALLRDKAFVLRPALIKETILSRGDLEIILKDTYCQLNHMAVAILIKSPVRIVLLEKEHALTDLIAFVGPNTIEEAPLGTLTKLFGENSVACPRDEKHLKTLMHLFYPEISI